jgi:hypothetical protein
MKAHLDSGSPHSNTQAVADAVVDGPEGVAQAQAMTVEDARRTDLPAREWGKTLVSAVSPST